ncbi:MAG: peptidase M4 family protein [wastewater metagenome]|nr:peptidase M4 family protein [Candidatus Loosdrechtia aerotolerans]
MKNCIKGIIFFLIIFQCSFIIAEEIPSFVTKEQRNAILRIKEISSENLHIKWDKKKDIVKFISGRLATSDKKSAVQLSKDFIKRNRVLFGIQDPEKEIEWDHTDSTPKGYFIQFKQKKGSLDVIGGKITVRVDKGIITTIANHFEPNIPVGVIPAISPEKAAAIAKTAVDISDQKFDGGLAILPWEEKFYLIYRIDFPFTSNPVPSRYRVYVDANNGSVILVENRVMHIDFATGTGIGVDGVLKTFDTYEKTGVFYLGNIPNSNRTFIKVRTYTANNTENLPGSIMTDSDNYWEDPAGVDAHFHGNLVHDFYQNNFGNFSWFFGSGFNTSGGITSTVHYGSAYDNAFWNGNQMVYGDGNTMFHPLSGSLDVVAHEIAHGITEAINNLVYCKESGALNESWSDVMGMLSSIEYGYDLPYWIGEGIMKIDETSGYEAYYTLRRMDDPSFRTDNYPENDYNPDNPLSSWGQPEHTTEQYHANCWPWTDYGGVHINSGIPNKAAYLITTNIGFEKAKQIYYYAMFYLSSDSQFVDARDAIEQTTIDLYGIGSELSAVQTAFDAVGIQ